MPVAVETVRRTLGESEAERLDVVFCCFSSEDRALYLTELGRCGEEAGLQDADEYPGAE